MNPIRSILVLVLLLAIPARAQLGSSAVIENPTTHALVRPTAAQLRGANAIPGLADSNTFSGALNTFGALTVGSGALTVSSGAINMVAGPFNTSGIVNTGILNASGLASLNAGTATTTLAASGALTALTFNGLTISTSTGTLTIANGKTLTASNTLTLVGTDGSSVQFGTGGTVVYTTDIGDSIQAYDEQLDTWATITPGSGHAAILAADSTSMTQIVIAEEFAGGTPSDLYGGENGWRVYADTTGATFARVAASGTAAAAYSITTSGTTNYGGTIILQGSGMMDDMGSNATGTWESAFRFKVSTLTNARFVVGWTSGSYGAQTTCDKIAITYEAGTDTNFQLSTDSGSATKTDLGVAPSADTYYTVKIWSDAAGTIKARVHGATGTALGNEVSTTSTVPNTEMSPQFFVGDTGATAHVMTCDAFRFRATVAR